MLSEDIHLDSTQSFYSDREQTQPLETLILEKILKRNENIDKVALNDND